MTAETRCCCKREDEWDCYAQRHGFSRLDTQEMEADGGPCECICHYLGDNDKTEGCTRYRTAGYER